MLETTYLGPSISGQERQYAFYVRVKSSYKVSTL